VRRPSTREYALLAILVTVLLSIVIKEAIKENYEKRFSEIQQRIELLDRKLALQQQVLGNSELIERAYAQIGATKPGENQLLSTTDMIADLQSMSSDFISISSIRPLGQSQLDLSTGPIMIELSFSATLSKTVQFLYTLERSANKYAVSSLDITSRTSEDQGLSVNAIIKLSRD